MKCSIGKCQRRSWGIRSRRPFMGLRGLMGAQESRRDGDQVKWDSGVKKDAKGSLTLLLRGRRGAHQKIGPEGEAPSGPTVEA